LLVYFRTVKYLSTARMPTGYGLKDKGQERQEAKTQDSQDDERLEAFKRKGKGTYHGRYLLTEKQGLLKAYTERETR